MAKEVRRVKHPHKNWDDQWPEYSESAPEQKSWECGVYQTGSTQPPKSHGGLIAGLLAAVIFLGGIASALGVLNIRLFQQMQDAPEPNQDALALIGTQPAEATQPETQFSSPAAPATETWQKVGGDVTIELHQAPESVENISQEGGLSFQEIYEKNISGVVSITSRDESGAASSGTGVVFTADGYLVTNYHVVEAGESISVIFSDGQTREASLVGSDPMTDLAVLYVAADGLTPVEFGDSSTLRVGDTVAAIGDPLGVELRGTMTDGIISGINRDITVGGRTMTLIQTTAALNEGNSGGPLINCYGQVIGINTMKVGDEMSAGGVEGLGFAIPSTTVKEIVDQLLRQGYVSGRPTLGLEVEEVSRFYQLYYGLPAGAYITDVAAGSAAAEVGIAQGDILLCLDDTAVVDQESLTELLYSYQVGDTLEAVIYRGGKQYRVTLTVTEFLGNS